MNAIKKTAKTPEALLAEFKAKDNELHREWTAAVGTPDYIKRPWLDREDALLKEYREKLTSAGYPVHAPLLPMMEDS